MKKENRELKSDLENLEKEICEITDTVQKFKQESKEIVEDLRVRIAEKEAENARLREECTASSADAKASEERHVLENRVDAQERLKTFLGTCKEEMWVLEDQVKEEIAQFRRMLQFNHQKLGNQLEHEFSSFSPRKQKKVA